MINKIIILTILFLSNHLWAEEAFDFPNLQLGIESNSVENKLDYVINNPEGALKRYTPVGGVVKNKTILQKEVSFTMIKKILMVNRPIYVHFSLDISPYNKCELSNEKVRGYELSIDLVGSEDLVYDNIKKLDLFVCIDFSQEEKAVVNVQGKIIKGDNYSEVLGPIAKKTIVDQVDPFMDAIKLEVQSL